MAPSNFLDLADGIITNAVSSFGETVSYLPKSGGRHQLEGIFDNTFEQVDPDTEQVVATNQPILGLRNADLKFEIKKGDRVIVRGQKYRVVDSQEDGIAAVSVLLHKVEAT